MAQRRHNFISGAAVLALAVAVTKVLGALYKIPLGNLLDKEGMAHFYAAYNIYNLLLVLSTAGLPLALSRLVSRAAAQGRRNAQRRIFRTALALLAVIGLVCSAVMCLFPQVLSGLLHDSLAAPAIRVLGPAVLFVCLTSAIRGYTQGLGDMTPTAVSQMTESAGKLVIGLALCLVLLHRGADSSLCAAGAIAGVTAGSLLSLTVLTVFLLRRRDRAAVNVIKLERLRAAKVLKNVSVFIRDCNAHKKWLLSAVCCLQHTAVSPRMQVCRNGRKMHDVAAPWNICSTMALNVAMTCPSATCSAVPRIW